MDRNSKRRFQRLSVDKKLEIVRCYENGQKQSDLAAEYGVSGATVSYIVKNKNNIKEFDEVLKSQNGRTDKRTRTTGVENNRMEQALYAWFTQKRSQGEPISGQLLQEKARYFNSHLGGPSTFTASNGWLLRFKTRHQIRQVSVQGEKLSADEPARVAFCEHFSQYLADNNVHPDNVYNADESGLAWKTLPRHTLATSLEKGAAGRKIEKDRVTILTCANATGTHRIPLLVIGKSMKPRCFKNININSVVNYTASKNRKAWMTTDLFLEWYRNEFLPKVKERKPNERFILLLDNAPTHPRAEILNSMDECCEVRYLPPNVTSLIQPMDQGVIAALKKLYKGSFLQELIAKDCENSSGVQDFIKSWTLLDCCRNIAACWNNISENTLKNSWNKIFPNLEVYDEHHSDILLSYANCIPGTSTFSTENIQQWVLEDDNLPTWYAFSDEELIENSGKEPTQVVEQEEEDEAGNMTVDGSVEKPVPSLREAMTSLDTVRDWCESRWDMTPQQISTLHTIRQLVLNEIVVVNKY